MSYLGRWEINDLLTFAVNTHAAQTLAAADADNVPTYRVYKDETGAAIVTGSMAKLDDANTVGFYSEQITLSAANGFEAGKCYTIYVSATVGGTIGTLSHSFQVETHNWDELTSGHQAAGTTGKALSDATAAATPDTRDLEPVQHVWQLRRSGDGALRATNAVVLHRGDTDVRVGWNCDTPVILPGGAVLSTMTTPTSSDDTSGVNVDAKLGVDPKIAKVALSADADAVVGDYWITTTVTNNHGGGPIAIYGKVTVQAAP